MQPIVDPEQIGKPVIERDGKVIRMADLGQVVIDPGPMIGDGVVDDGPGLLLVVQKYRGANTVEVTRGVEEAMREMQPGLPGSRSTPRSSGQPRSSSSRWTTCASRCCWALPWWH